jgi:CCR4-NOT transcriptional regulation complex NOT5 subunit
MNNNTNKYTAALTTVETKNAIVALRNDSKLSEKELMTLIVDIAVANKDVIMARAAELTVQNDAAREARRTEAYQALKAKLAEAREAKKQAKPAKEVPAPSKPKKVKKEVAVTQEA